MREEKRKIILLITTLLIICLDRLTKGWFLFHNLATLNKDLTWGIPAPLGLRPYIIYFLLTLSTILVFYFFKKKNPGLILILLGGFLNLLDRIIWGGVVDFINLSFIPTFNIADIAIAFGILILLVDLLKAKTI